MPWLRTLHPRERLAYLDWIARTSGVTADSTVTAPVNTTTPTTPTVPTTEPTIPAPLPGTVTYNGTIYQGETIYAPDANGFAYAGGTLKAVLSGPTGTDYDLYLQSKTAYGSWTNVARSMGTTSSENISYQAAKGTYRWAVKSYKGTGSVTLTETK